MKTRNIFLVILFCLSQATLAHRDAPDWLRIIAFIVSTAVFAWYAGNYLLENNDPLFIEQNDESEI